MSAAIRAVHCVAVGDVELQAAREPAETQHFGGDTLRVGDP